MAPYHFPIGASHKDSKGRLALNAVSDAIRNLSPQYLIHVLKESLGRPPGPPPGCPALILGCLVALDVKEYPYLAGHHRDLLLLWQEFITAPRPMSQMRALLAQRDCACAHGPAAVRGAPPELHQGQFLHIHDSVMEPGFADILGRLAQRLSGYIDAHPDLSRMYDLRWSKRYARRSPRLVVFPSSCHDLLPFGPEDSFMAIDRWLAMPGPHERSLLKLASQIMAACRSQLIPILLCCPRLLRALTLEKATQCTKLFANGDTLYYPHVTAAIQDCAIAANFMDTLRRTASVEEIWALFEAATPKSPTFDTLCACITVGVSLQALFMSEQSLELLSGQERREAEKAGVTFSMLAGDVLFARPELRARATARCGELPIGTSMWLKSLDDGRRTTDLHAARVMSWFGDARALRCTAPACAQTAARLGRALQRCNGCGVAPYCSRACQRSAWRHPACAHRDVCADFVLLRRLIDAKRQHTFPRAAADRLARHHSALIKAQLKSTQEHAAKIDKKYEDVE